MDANQARQPELRLDSIRRRSVAGIASLSVLVRYVVVGGLATVIHYALAIAFVLLGLLEPVAASGTGFALSALLNYYGNLKFTFRGARGSTESLLRFIAVAGSGCLINTSLFWLLGNSGMQLVPAQLLTTAMVLAWSYILNAAWTFADHGND